MNTPTSTTLSHALRALRAAPITAINFVEDYVQIEASGGRMTILEPLCLEGGGRSLKSGNASFAVELNACTGASIEEVHADESQVALHLSNGKTLRIALSEPTGSRETFIYQDLSGHFWVAGPSGAE